MFDTEVSHLIQLIVGNGRGYAEDGRIGTTELIGRVDVAQTPNK